MEDISPGFGLQVKSRGIAVISSDIDDILRKKGVIIDCHICKTHMST